MNAGALAKNYSRLTPEERFRLLLAASGRGDEAERDRLPGPAGLIHSAASWRLSQITSMYIPRRDYPTDADLWRRVANESQAKGLESLYAPKVTVVKDSEHRLLLG